MRKRWQLLTLLSVLGILTYVPALGAMGVPITLVFVASFTALGTLVCALAVWLGLRWADRADLPMPLLRTLDAAAATRSLDRWAAALAIGGGTILALAAAGAVQALDLVNMPGSLGARLLSTLFAAISLEVVLHLAIMSGVVAWTRSRWTGIAVSTLAFLLFHVAGATSQPPGILAVSVLLNGASGLFFGWMYARYGFECLILAHAVAHALAVGLG